MTPLQRALRGREGESVVFLTGAGISAESGIPTFRGEEGYWTVGSRHYRPTELATRAAFARMPEAIWAWYLYRRSVCLAAQPNPAHLALARLESRLGARFLLVTQNVDGLHGRAGNSAERTYEVHGNIHQMRCWQECCGRPVPLPEGLGPKAKDEPLTAEESALLVCPRCGGPARPHVLWFDECYDEERFRFESSLQAIRQAGVLVTVGSSGATNLPLQMARLAVGHGVTLVDINPEPNPFAEMARASGGVWLARSAVAGLQELDAVWDPGQQGSF